MNDYTHIDSSILLRASIIRLKAMFEWQLYLAEENPNKSSLVLAIEASKTA